MSRPKIVESAVISLGGGPKPGAVRRTGILLINLGTPDSPDASSVRRYLAEFLSDRRVIELPRIIWWPVLYGLVLPFRPRRSARAYAKIWDTKENDSPLRVITARQARKLAEAPAGREEIIVDFAMRYGNPPIGARLEAMRAQGCERMLLLPLYPQYSATTTATANDKAFEALGAMRWQPAVRTAAPYFDDPVYVEAIAQSIVEGLAGLKQQPQLVITSYHGMPESYVRAGDPYRDHCLETTRLVAAKLGWPANRLMVTFQSRFGRSEWLKPYTAETLTALPKNGVQHLAVITPGFSADCLETLEEIAIEGQATFLAAGGRGFTFLPCLNDSAAGMRVIKSIVDRELSGWA